MAVQHPLDGARLKIVRAQEHLDAFKADVGTFISAKPYRIESEVYDEHWWVKPRVTAEPDIALSAIVGDCVTNARAALDYIMWELSCKYLVPTVDLTRPEDRRVTAFPIFQKSATEPGYRDRINRLTKRQMPTDALAEVDAAQPDISGNPALAWLHQLVNHDKHRMPVLTATVIGTAQIGLNEWRGQAVLLRSDFLRYGVAIKAPRDLLDAVRSGEMKVDIQASAFVASSNVPMPDVPLERTLEQIVETVAHIVPRFDRFF